MQTEIIKRVVDIDYTYQLPITESCEAEVSGILKELSQLNCNVSITTPKVTEPGNMAVWCIIRVSMNLHTARAKMWSYIVCYPKIKEDKDDKEPISVSRSSRSRSRE